MEQAIRGKRFYLFEEDSELTKDLPSILRILSYDKETKSYTFESEDIKRDNSITTISKEQLFLFYKALKPDYVMTSRIFEQENSKGNKVENAYLTVNPYLEDESELDTAKAQIIDLKEFIEYTVNQQQDRTYRIIAKSDKTTYYDYDRILILKAAKDVKWKSRFVWFGYMDDNVEAIFKRLEISKILDRFRIQAKKDIKNHIITFWTENLLDKDKYDEIVKQCENMTQTTMLSTVVFQLTHVCPMYANMYIDDAYKNKAAFVKLIEDAMKTETIKDEDPLRKKNLERAKRTIANIHLLANNDYPILKEPDMSSIVMVPYTRFGSKPVIRKESDRYIVLLKFWDASLWLIYTLIPVKNRPPAMSKEEIETFLKPKS